MRRKRVNIADAPHVAGVSEWWQVPIENMGVCRDGVTRWYFFDAKDGTPCITFKYQGGDDKTTRERIDGKMKVSEWEERLLPIDMEALRDYGHAGPEEDLTAKEVMDIIVDWNGGIVSGYAIRALVARVYGKELE